MEEERLYHGINRNTYEMLFGDRHNIPMNEWQLYENLEALIIIDKFTKIDRKNPVIKMLNSLRKNLKRISFNPETKTYEYNYNGTRYTFRKLSDHIADKEIKKELTSNKRYGKCHHRSLRLAPSIKNSKVTTGYITIGKDKIFHSVVEYPKKDKIIVLDWTKNLYMTKEQYIELFNFEELSSFPGEKVLEDQEGLMGELISQISVKAYVLFRDEIKEEIDKISKKEENNKKLTLKK